MAGRPLIGVVACAVLGGAVFLVAERVSRPRTSWGVRDVPRAGSTPPLAGTLASAQADLREGRFETAQRSLEQLKGLDPWFERQKVETLLSQCEREIAAKQHVGRARELIDARRYALARQELSAVPESTTQAGARRGLEWELEEHLARLLSEARALQAGGRDRESMEELERRARSIAEIEPELPVAGELQAHAEAALADLDDPESGVRRRFDRGEVKAALEMARGCAAEVAACGELVAPLARLSVGLPKAKSLSTAKLLELFASCEVVSGGENRPGDELGELITSRYEAAAKKCRAARNWVCVDKQLTLANELGYGFEDATIETALGDHVRGNLLRVASQRGRDPKAVQAVVQQVLEMTSLEPQLYELARQVGEQMAWR